jgi:hypothetical protein
MIQPDRIVPPVPVLCQTCARGAFSAANRAAPAVQGFRIAHVNHRNGEKARPAMAWRGTEKVAKRAVVLYKNEIKQHSEVSR